MWSTGTYIGNYFFLCWQTLYAQTWIPPSKWDTLISLGLWNPSQLANHSPKLRYNFNKQEEKKLCLWPSLVHVSQLVYNFLFGKKVKEHPQTEVCEKKINSCHFRQRFILLYFDPRPSPKMLFQGDTPEGSDTFQWPIIERDCVGGLRLMIWDKVKVPLCHYSDAPEESNLWTAWQLFPLDDD